MSGEGTGGRWRGRGGREGRGVGRMERVVSGKGEERGKVKKRKGRA